MLQGELDRGDAVGRIAGAAPVEGSSFEASDVTMFETVFELPMAAGVTSVPAALDMEFPATVRLFAWEWPQSPDDPASPRNRLAGLRVMCRKGAVRMSWPLAGVYQGDRAAGQELRAAGVPAVEGACKIDVYHDIATVTVAGGFDTEVRCDMQMQADVNPAGLQWNIAALACPLGAGEGAGEGAEPALGLAAVQHSFSKLRTGRPVVAGGSVTVGGKSYRIGWPIGGLVARGDVRVGPLERIGVL